MFIRVYPRPKLISSQASRMPAYNAKILKTDRQPEALGRSCHLLSQLLAACSASNLALSLAVKVRFILLTADMVLRE